MIKKRNIYTICGFIFLMMSPTLSFGQQEPQFTQYMYNTISINPAFAGSREFLVVSLLNRNQWVGIDGAPCLYRCFLHYTIK